MQKIKSWLPQVLTDILVTILIVITVLLEYRWLEYVVISYTYLMLTIKILVTFNQQLQAIVKKSSSHAPKWFYHFLYAVNVVVLALFGWIFTASAWTMIWALSEYQRRKLIF